MDLVKAKFSNGVITSDDGFKVSADVAGAAKGESSGVVILDKDKGFYIPLDTFQNLMSIIDGIVNLCDSLSGQIEGAIVGATTAGSATAQTVNAAGPGLSTLKSSANNIKNQMNELKKVLK